MNTEEIQSRRDLIVTRIVVALAAAGALFINCGLPWASAYHFAAALLVALCYVCNVQPHKVAWRMLRRAVGHRHDTRFAWGELSFHRPRFDIGLKLTNGYNDPEDLVFLDFIVGCLVIKMPFVFCGREKEHAGMTGYEPCYGFYTIDTSIVWRWNRGYYSWNIPFFSFRHLSTEILTIDGKQTVFIERSGKGRRFLDRWEERRAAQHANSQQHSYTYIRRNGEMQRRTATIYVDRMTWARKWAPFILRVRTGIWVDFNEEIGEEVGSWKGGTTGCGYEMKRGESALDTLRRMERERKFERGR